MSSQPSQKLLRDLSKALTIRGKRFTLSYNTLTVSNVPEIDGRFNGNTHEEADTLVILHTIDVAHLNPFWHVWIMSLDTDVLLLLIHYYPQLPVLVLFESGSQKINIAARYEILGHKQSNAFLVFYAFTCFDQTSRFNENSKATCWKTFLDASEDVLTAFADLGVTDHLADLTVTNLEKYVMRLFCESSNLSSITDIKWSMYIKQQDCNKFPPTKA